MNDIEEIGRVQISEGVCNTMYQYLYIYLFIYLWGLLAILTCPIQ